MIGRRAHDERTDDDAGCAGAPAMPAVGLRWSVGLWGPRRFGLSTKAEAEAEEGRVCWCLASSFAARGHSNWESLVPTLSRTHNSGCLVVFFSLTAPLRYMIFFIDQKLPAGSKIGIGAEPAKEGGEETVGAAKRSGNECRTVAHGELSRMAVSLTLGSLLSLSDNS